MVEALVAHQDVSHRKFAEEGLHLAIDKIDLDAFGPVNAEEGVSKPNHRIRVDRSI
jgi:hypothetical protein